MKEIVVLQRGWVMVGDVEKNGSEFVIKNGSVIRIWGTTSGLGELAEKGPLKNTVLDPIRETKAHELTVVFRMACNVDNWK